MSKEKKMKYKVIAGILLAVITLFFYVAELWSGQNKEINILDSGETPVSAEDFPEEVIEQSNLHNSIIVDICGAVNLPGVYELEEGSRLYEAIDLAGGLTDDACLRLVNRAAPLIDGEKIYIYTEKEAKAEASSGLTSSTKAEGSGKVNINTANSETLQELKGIGPVTASKIINYRNSYGPFKTVEDIMNVSGIGEKTFAGFKESIRVN